jgi:two-component system sensor histidine kinase FlrB
VIRRQASAIAPDGKQLTLNSGKRIALSNQVRDSYGDQVVLITDVTEAHAAQEANNRKQRLSALGEMVARLAHQIRTPLSSALLYMGQLSRQTLSVEHRLKMTSKVTDRLQHMESLVNSSLSFVQGGEVDTQDCSLFELLDALKLSLLPKLQQQSGVWKAHLPNEDVLIQANREALLSALVSIAENALQVVAKPELTISAYLQTKTLDITIADNGPGVDAKIIGHIFDPFYTTRQGGTGLGLALAAMIAQSHDAELTVQNNASSGAVFTLHLPISRIRLTQSDVEKSPEINEIKEIKKEIEEINETEEINLKLQEDESHE